MSLLLIRRSLITPRQAAPAGESYPDLILSRNPLVYFRLNETSGTSAADATGTYAGTYVNSPALGEPGVIDTAVAFNGSAQRVETDVNDLTLGGANPLSIEWWFKASSQSSPNMHFGANNSGTSERLWAYWGSGTVGTDRLRVDYSSGGTQKNAVTNATASSLADGQWHHVVAVYHDANTAMDIYIDGVDDLRENSQNGTTSTVNTLTRPLFLAARNNNGTPDLHWPGTIDEFAIYDQALTAAEVAENYDAAA